MPSAKKKKRAAKPQGRGRGPRNFNAALWSTPMCTEWSGLPRAQLMELIRAREIESVTVGPAVTHLWHNGTVRHRSCAKFLVVAKSLKAFVEGLGARGKLQRSA
jgi:hypothetical protein